MTVVFLTTTFPVWADILAGVLGLYLFFIFFKQCFQHYGEARTVYLVLAFCLVPVLLLIHYLARWNLNSPQFIDPANGWMIPVKDSKNFNLIEGLLVLILWYLVASALMSLLAWYYRVRTGASMLALRKLIVKLVVLLVGAVVYLNLEGINLTPLWVGMGAASLVLGFALQEPLATLFKGISLDMEGVYLPGDWIRVGGAEGLAGKVVDKNWRTTRILTIDDELVTIPNSVLGSETIINYHQPRRAHVHRMNIGTSYNDPPVKVKEVLRTILMREPRILGNPPPVVRTIGYNDFSIDYELKFWINDYGEHPGICDAVMTQVWYAFKFYGIEIPFPIRTVHMKDQEHLTKEAKTLDASMMDIMAFFHTLPYFSSNLNYKDLHFLARNAFQRWYRPGEHVIHKGDMGDALYIVREGSCEVFIKPDARRTIGEKEYFGEMGLISSRPRTADVVAGEVKTLAVRIDSECMHVLFKRYPALLDEFEQVKVARMEDTGLIDVQAGIEKIPLGTKISRALRDLVKPW